VCDADHTLTKKHQWQGSVMGRKIFAGSSLYEMNWICLSWPGDRAPVDASPAVIYLAAGRVLTAIGCIVP
jgi:hypothetical protein